MCGPKFCSMKISQDIRDYAGGGMTEKARESRAGGKRADVPEPPAAGRRRQREADRQEAITPMSGLEAGSRMQG
jgi:hypothetical protein